MKFFRRDSDARALAGADVEAELHASDIPDSVDESDDAAEVLDLDSMAEPVACEQPLRFADGEILDIDTHVGDTNGELDALEDRLLKLRQRGEGLDLGAVVEPPSPVARGTVETLDLRALMTLRDDAELTALDQEDEDDEFGQRFKEFANVDADLRSRRWFEQS